MKQIRIFLFLHMYLKVTYIFCTENLFKYTIMYEEFSAYIS